MSGSRLATAHHRSTFRRELTIQIVEEVERRSHLAAHATACWPLSTPSVEQGRSRDNRTSQFHRPPEGQARRRYSSRGVRELRVADSCGAGQRELRPALMGNHFGTAHFPTRIAVGPLAMITDLPPAGV